MSSILKALQKLEQERAARRGGPPDISGDILKQGKSVKPAPRWLLPTAMTAVGLLAVLMTYSLMGGFAAKKTGTAPIATPLAASLTTPPVLSQPGSVPTGDSGTKATAPALPPAEVIKEVPVARRTVTRQASLTPARTRRPATPASAPPQQAAATPPKADTPQPAPAKPSRPSLNVGGIAWQQNNSLRLAVVNGMSVTEGSAVEGARVEEIFPDRIRFSIRNEHFEVPLEK